MTALSCIQSRFHFHGYRQRYKRESIGYSGTLPDGMARSIDFHHAPVEETSGPSALELYLSAWPQSELHQGPIRQRGHPSVERRSELSWRGMVEVRSPREETRLTQIWDVVECSSLPAGMQHSSPNGDRSPAD